MSKAKINISVTTSECKKPLSGTVCTGHNLAEALAKTELSDVEAGAWSRDLKTARHTLTIPADKWR
jgi:hypothetical protein